MKILDGVFGVFATQLKPLAGTIQIAYQYVFILEHPVKTINI